MIVDGLVQKGSSMRRNSGDADGVAKDWVDAGLPDFEFTVKRKGPVSQNLAEPPVSLPAELEAMLQVGDLKVGIADFCSQVRMMLDHLDGDGGLSYPDANSRLSAVKLCEAWLQGASRRSALQ